jgi:hypothetical protein
MAAPTRRKRYIKETLAKGEPSTHDPKRTWRLITKGDLGVVSSHVVR